MYVYHKKVDVSGVLWYDDQKAVKRRVDHQVHHRESALVRAGMEGMVENGLGAAHRSIIG